MSEINRSPVQQYIPDLNYPKALAKLIRDAEASHAKWRNAYAEVVAADAALTRAPAKDQTSLVDAVAAGKDYSGHVSEHAARLALEVAEERCRVAREAATAQTDVVKAALAAATEELVPIVIANVRATADAHATSLQRCKAIEEESRINLRNALTAMRMVAPHIATRYGISVGWHEASVPEPGWPVNPLVMVLSRIEHLDQMIGQADQAKSQPAAVGA